MQKDNKHIDQEQLSTLRSEVADLKNMVSMMQEIIVSQNKQISDIHKALFNHPKKTKQELYEERVEMMKAKILMKGIGRRNK